MLELTYRFQTESNFLRRIFCIKNIVGTHGYACREDTPLHQGEGCGDVGDTRILQLGGQECRQQNMEGYSQ